jgi:hypothetical protein
MHVRTGLVAVVALALAAGPRLARAADKGGFDAVAEQATRVNGPKELAGALWSGSGSCAGQSNDLDRRQCEGIREARVAQVQGKTFLVAGDAQAVIIGKYDAKKKSIAVAIQPCIACAEPVDIGGERYFLVGGGGVSVAKGAIKLAPVHRGAQPFAAAEASARWARDASKRVRVDFLVRSGKLAPWTKGGARGYTVPVVGYRAYDVCTGKVIAAKPAAADVEPDRRACAAEAEAEAEAQARAKADEAAAEAARAAEAAAVPAVPAQLAPADISRAMQPVAEEAQKCLAAYGVSGKANFAITVSGDGKVMDVVQSGDFVDTPTGTCLEAAIKAREFPRTQRKSTSFAYPVVL